jgi:undecaprenyl-diphosphatase
MAMAGALTVTRMLPRSSWILWPIAALIAASRIYLGMHWPTDVVAGAAFGLAVAWFVLGGRPTASRS